ncbi:MAG: MmcQ/YjbR family DNA-binding protein [Lachnospiraceae bacterium]|nr:MmcQ/YjbR family DNA-binding protein [Lachnospiraceae bacterium]
MTLRDSVFKYIKDKYMADPEYLWRRYPGYAVFRHKDNNKWFAVVMDVARDKVGLNGEERIDILDIKVSDPLFADALVSQKGFCRGYHLNKANWVTVFLDGIVSMKTICSLIDDSFMATASARKKEKIRPPKEWVIPANPKYYDIVHAFDEADEINWKQGSGIKTGDTVFMYVGSPVSAILYKCKVTETDIPYSYQDDNLTIKALMKIKLIKRYKPDKFTFEVLNDEYGIYAVRGPRGIPNSLSEALK